jgi:hypothetical protein
MSRRKGLPHRSSVQPGAENDDLPHVGMKLLFEHVIYVFGSYPDEIHDRWKTGRNTSGRFPVSSFRNQSTIGSWYKGLASLFSSARNSATTKAVPVTFLIEDMSASQTNDILGPMNVNDAATSE